MQEYCSYIKVEDHFDIKSFININSPNIIWPISKEFLPYFRTQSHLWKIPIQEYKQSSQPITQDGVEDFSVYVDKETQPLAELYAYLTKRTAITYDDWTDSVEKNSHTPKSDVFVLKTSNLKPGLIQVLNEQGLLGRTGFITGDNEYRLYNSIIFKSLYQFLKNNTSKSNIAYLPSLSINRDNTPLLTVLSKDNSLSEVQSSKDLDIFALLAHSDGQDIELGNNEYSCPYFKLSKEKRDSIKNPLNCLKTNLCYRTQLDIDTFLNSSKAKDYPLVTSKIFLNAICNGFLHKNKLTSSEHSIFNQTNDASIVQVTTQSFEAIPQELIFKFIKNMVLGISVGEIIHNFLKTPYFESLKATFIIFGDPRARFKSTVRENLREEMFFQLSPKKSEKIQGSSLDMVKSYISSFKEYSDEELTTEKIILENISYTPDIWFHIANEKNVETKYVLCHSCNDILARRIGFTFQENCREIILCPTCGIVGDQDLNKEINFEINSKRLRFKENLIDESSKLYLIERFQSKDSRRIVELNNQSKPIDFEESKVTRALTLLQINAHFYSYSTIYHRLKMIE